MKFSGKISGVVALAVILGGFLLSCDNPFDQGLGGKVNITPPEITISSPAPMGVLSGPAATIRGTATDDRKVVKIEAGLYNDIGDEAPQSWTTEGIHFDGGGEWTFTLDTTTFTNANVSPTNDGVVKLKFRVFDEGSDPVETAALVYIIKNNAPTLSVTTPEEGVEILITGEDSIRGSAEDLVGIRPGYPMIQIWPVESFPGADQVPPDDDPDWGWVSTQITGYDANDMASLGYARTVIPFEFKLKNFTISPAKQPVFSDTPLPADKQYRFRLKVRDFSAEQDGEGRLIETPDREKEGLYPQNALYRELRLDASVEQVRISLEPLGGVSEPDGGPRLWLKNPTENVMEKTGDVFILRVTASHSQTIEKAELAWALDGAPIYFDDPHSGHSDYYRAPGHKLEWTGITEEPLDDSGHPEKGHTLNDNRSKVAFVYRATKPPFAHSITGYKLYVRVKSGAATTPEMAVYTVYVDGQKPTVGINGVKGASKAGTSTTPYVVNDSIEVTIGSPSDLGTNIRPRSPGSAEQDIWWLRVPVAEETAVEGLVNAYETAPSQTSLDAIRNAKTAIAGAAGGDITGTKFTVGAAANGNYLLYIFVLDNACNLGFAKQQLHYDAATDKPVITLPSQLENVTPSPVPYADALGAGQTLDIAVDVAGAASGNTGRKNILTAGQSISLTLADDDGLDLGAGTEAAGAEKIKISITGLNGPTKTVAAADIAALFGTNGTEAKKAETALITQAVLGKAWDGSGALPDGVYRLDIEVSDRAADKVGSAAPAKTTNSFWFVQCANPPQITVDSPAANTVVSSAVTVQGTVKSRLKIQRLWAKVPFAGGNTVAASNEVTLYQDAARTLAVSGADNEPVPVDGLYTYYWNLDIPYTPGAAGTFFSGTDGNRTIEFTAADGFNNRAVAGHTLAVDKKGPEISVTDFIRLTGGPGAIKVNGRLTFKLNAQDDNGIKGYRWWILPSSPADANRPVPGAGWNYSDTSAPLNSLSDSQHKTGFWHGGAVYTHEFDTNVDAGGLAPGNYTLYAIAVDNAGNLSLDNNVTVPDITAAETEPGYAAQVAANYSARLKKYGRLQDMTIDQSSDIPTLTNVKPGTLTDIVPLTGTSITGNLNDDDGFSGAAGFIEISFPTNWTTFIPVNNGSLINNGTAISFSFDLAAYVAGAATDVKTYFSGDGPKSYRIRVKDDAAKKAGLAAKGNGTDGQTFTFTLDSLKPVIIFDNNPMVGGTARPTFANAAGLLAALHGEIEETNIHKITDYDNGYIDVSFNGEDLRRLPLTVNKEWSLPADYFVSDEHGEDPYDGGLNPFAKGAQGPQTLDVVVWDAAGNSERVQWTYYKDTAGPELSITTVKQTAIPADGDWPASWPNGWPTPGGAWETGPDSKFTDYFKSVIKNWDTAWASKTKAQILDELRTDPAMRQETISGTAGSDTTCPKIRGNFADLYSFIRNTDTDGVKFSYRFNSAGKADTTKSWTEKALWGTADGTPLPDATKNDGQKTVYWEIPVPETYGGSPVNDGLNTFDIKVQDKAGNETAVYNLAFRVDRHDPEITVVSTSPDLSGIPVPSIIGTVANDGTPVLTLNGQVSDANLKRLSARLGNGADTELSVTGSAWTFPVTGAQITALPGDDAALQTITITALDDADHQTVQNWEFYKDTKKPEIEFANLEKGAAGTTFGSDPAGQILQGSVSDGNKIKTARYNIAKWDYTAGAWRYWNGSGFTAAAIPAVTAAGWVSLLPGGYTAGNAQSEISWTIKLNEAGLGATPAEGQYKLNIYAEDYSHSSSASGNPAQTNDAAALTANDAPRIFFVDSAAPDLTLTDPKAYYKNGTGNKVTFTGKVGDANTIITVRGRLDNADFTAVEDNVSASETFSGTGEQTWTLQMPMPAALASVDANRSYTLYVEAVDAAGKVTTVNHDFILDNTVPSLSFTSQLGTGNVVTGQVMVRGGGSDDPPSGGISSGLDSGAVQYRFHSSLPWQDAAPCVINSTTVSALTGSAASWVLDLKDVTNFVTGTIKTTIGMENGHPAPSNMVFAGTDITGKTIFTFPIYFKVTDRAGNVKEETKTLAIYPEGDKPVVSISNPNPDSSEAERTMAGKIRIFGLAKDNGQVWDVIYRVLDDGGSPVRLKKDGATYLDEVVSAGHGITAGQYWYAASDGCYSPNVSWGQDINVNGELTAYLTGAQPRRKFTVEVKAFDAQWNASGDGWIDWSAAEPDRSDGRRMIGEAARADIFLEAGPPEFRDELVLGNTSNNWNPAAALPIGSASMSKKASYKVTIRDEGGIKNISWRKEPGDSWSTLMEAGALDQELADDPTAAYNSGLTAALAGEGIAMMAKPKTTVKDVEANKYYLIWNSLDSADRSALGISEANNKRFTVFTPSSPRTLARGVVPAVDVGGKRYYDWEVTIDVDTEKLGYANKGENYTLYLQATDITSPNSFTGTKVVQLPFDNYYPFGYYTGNSNVAGSSYTVQGAAYDRAGSVTVEGISKVVLWFEKSGVRYSPLDGTSFTSTGTVKAAGGRYVSGPVGALSDVAIDPAQTENVLSNTQTIVIDRDDPLGSQGQRQAAGFGLSGDGREWYVRINSTDLTAANSTVFAGPVTLKYLVYDTAGNITCNEQRLVFRNGAPVISTVTLGTDLRKDSTLQSAADLAAIRAKFPGAGDNDAGISGPLSINYNSPGQHSANFTARNNLLVVRVETTAQTAATRNYRLDYVTGEGPEVAASALERGEVYLIKIGGGTNWQAVGAPSNWQPGTPFMANGTTTVGTGRAVKLNRLGVADAALKKEALNLAPGVSQLVEFAYNAAAFGTAGNTIRDGDNARFIIKVWDGAEANDFADLALVSIAVRNTDTTPPNTVRLYELNPKGEGLSQARTPEQAVSPGGIGDNETRGGVYNLDASNATRNISGHIEPRPGTTLDKYSMGHTSLTPVDISANGILGSYDTVSGRVILRGYVEDDLRVKSVTLKVDGGGSTTIIPILEADDAGTPGPNKTGRLKVPAAQNGRVFFADALSLDAHRVEWAYIWNTETIPDPANTIGNVEVQVSASNMANTGGTPASRTVTRAPYITGIKRAPGYNNDRSRQGWFLFSRGEAIEVQGFNLKDGAAVPTLALNKAVGTGTIPISGTAPANAADTAVSSVTFRIPGSPTTNADVVSNPSTGGMTYGDNGGADAVKSGPLAYQVGTTTDVNSRRPKVNPWNREESVREGTELWNDSRSAHVWQSNSVILDNGAYGTTGTYGNANGFFMTQAHDYAWFSPAMTMVPETGILEGVISNNGEDGYIRRSNNFKYGSLATIDAWEFPRYQGDVHTNNTRTNGSPDLYVAYNSILKSTNWASGGVWVTVSSNIPANRPYIPGNPGPPAGHYNPNITDELPSNFYLVEKAAYNQGAYGSAEQFANPHVVTSTIDGGGNDTHIHVSYHDAKDGSIKYRHFRQGTVPHDGSPDTSNGSNHPRQWINLDGGYDAEDHTAAGGGSDTGRVLGYPRSGPLPTVGYHNAIDVTSQGYPVIVYYDETNRKLKMAVANNKNPGGGNWTIQDVFNGGDPNKESAGLYVSARIDRTAGNSNRIHIAAFRQDDASLVYITGTQASPGGSYTFGASQAVDTGSVGKWADLSLDNNGNPYIVYQDTSKVNQYGGAKMAFIDTVKFGATGGWETMNIPARYTVDNLRLSIENWPARNVAPNSAGLQFWNAAVAYVGTSRFRIAYYVKY